MKKLIAALLFALASASPALAAPCGPIPALPDTVRRTEYAGIVAQTGPFNVNFQLYGDQTDYGAWLSVWVNGVAKVPVTDFIVTSPSGALGSLCLPITDAQVTFIVPQTGTIEIEGGQRPRRLSEFSENAGVTAHALNQVFNTMTAQLRERWDRESRLLRSPPGEVLNVLAPAANRANSILAFDGTGQVTLLSPTTGLGTVIGPNVTVSGHLATWNSTNGTILGDTGVGTGLSIGAGNLNISNTGVSATTYGDLTHVPQIAVNAQGQITSASNIAISSSDPAFVHLSTFSPVGDNSADDTTALQNWLNSCTAARKICYIDPPSVCYKITAALTVTSANGVTIQGPGMDKVGNGICLSSTTQNGIVATTLGQINLYEFKITGQALATAGDMFQLNSGNASPNQYSKIRGMWFQGGFIQAHFVTASGWTIYGGSLFASPNTGGISIFVEDTTAADAGDQAIIGNTFTGSAVGTAIIQTSAGGLKIVGNKIINYANGYILSMLTGVSTSDLFFSANSMEAFTGSGISLNKGSGTVFGTVDITGNEINGCGASCFGTDSTAGWLSNVILSSNHLSPNGGATCINIGTGTGIQVVNNNCQSGGGTTNGIVIGANVTSGLVANNIFVNGITTLYSGSSAGVRYVDHWGVTLAGLPASAANGSVFFLSDGAPASSPCTGASTGSTAFRQNGAWKCF